MATTVPIMLALDYGARYIGMAANDYTGLPYRYGTIDQKQEQALEKIQAIVTREKIEKILVGLPLNLDGEETKQTEVSKQFMGMVRKALPDISVEAVDETLTSVEAEKRIAFEGGNKADAHSEAARIFLEQYLVHHK